MKKIGLKITALLMSAALTITGCSSSGEVILESGEKEVTVNTTVSAAPEESVPEETDALTEDTTASDNPDVVTESTTEAEVSAAVTTNAVTQSGDNENPPSGNVSSSQSAGSSPQPGGSSQGGSGSSTSTSKPQNSPQNGSTGASFTTSWNPSNTWEENGNYCGSCELTVTNSGDSAVSGWTAKINVPNGFKITNSWNGNFSVSGTVLTVTNVDYNKDIAKGEKISFGFNYASPSSFTPPSNVTINGTVSSGNSGGGNGNSGGNGSGSGNSGNGGDNSGSNSGNGGSSTVTPLPAPAVIGLVKDHGKLSVKGTQLVDKNGNNFQLKGMSTHGLAWFPGFVNENAFKTLRDDWNTNVIRLAMYTEEYGGYCSGGNQQELKALIDKGVQAATKLGMYVIIDWHILHDNNPQTNKAEAKVFFEEMSKKYKNYDNVLYEICNEPNGGASWDGDIKPYAEEIIPIIRKNSPDSVIIVGTPTWSQDIDEAAANPLKEKNVLYALHFYAATHTDWLRQRLIDCYNKGLPVFVSEFGTCDASGNGSNDFNESKQWLTLLDKYGISCCNWNLANKNEASSVFKESASTDGNWSSGDYSEAGAWIRKWFRGEIE